MKITVRDFDVGQNDGFVIEGVRYSTWQSLLRGLRAYLVAAGGIFIEAKNYRVVHVDDIKPNKKSNYP